MESSIEYVVGTSGYSFADWVGTFYPPGTPKTDMLAEYVKHFDAVELNFTYYRLPSPQAMASMVRRTPEGFQFWVKANQETTHKANRAVAGEFLEGIEPLRQANRLAGVLLQFPQSFHRTVVNRTYLASAIEDLSSVPLAAEFRHCSWEHSATNRSLAERDVTLVVPDVPDLPALYHSPAAATTRTGYVRLHSRTAKKWYAGGAERYDYKYTPVDLLDMLGRWNELEAKVDKVFAFFNNCHRGQAAENAEAFRRILGQVE